jgi:ABC-type branched-subunit amino acid transport system substrate-binding protein
MLQVRLDKRRMLALGAGLLLAACKVIPQTGAPPVTTPTPGPSEPSANVLPTDSGRHRVALLVPLTGGNGEVGQSIANATTMALLDTNADNLRITTYDTATGASSAAARAIADGNKLILGPLLGDEVKAVIAEARPANVPLIAFSNDSTVAARDVFLMGQSPEQSIRRAIDYARGKGSKNFAALVPNGEYGRRAELAFNDAVRAAGGAIMSVQRYDRGNTSIVSAAQRLTASGGFDTVMIADSARLSIMAARELKEQTPSLHLIGTELWSGEADIASSAVLRGGWFAAISDDRWRQFTDSYQSRFGSRPYRVATLGYDAVLLTLRVARDWQPGKPFPTASMLDATGFLGLDGPFRFRRTGIGERAMEVRQVGNGTVTVVDPAPAKF